MGVGAADSDSESDSGSSETDSRAGRDDFVIHSCPLPTCETEFSLNEDDEFVVVLWGARGTEV